MKKMIALAMAMTMGLSLVACGSSDTAASTDTAAETTEAADTADTAEETEVPSAGGSYTIGICQLVQHEALDAATQGFKDAIVKGEIRPILILCCNLKVIGRLCLPIVHGIFLEALHLSAQLH